MISSARWPLALLVVGLLAPLVCGSALVSWTVDGAGLRGHRVVYPGELVNAQLSLVAGGVSPSGPLSIQFRSTRDVSFLRGNEIVPLLSVEVESLKPGAGRTLPVFFIVQPGDSNRLELLAFFSDDNGETWRTISVPLVRASPPLRIDARLDASFSDDHRGRVQVSLFNDSNETLVDVESTLILVSSQQAISPPLSIPFLEAGRSLANESLLFQSVAGRAGELPVWVRTRFSDARGDHVLLVGANGSLLARPQDSFDWLWLAFFVLLLIGVAVWFSRRGGGEAVGNRGEEHGASHGDSHGAWHGRRGHDEAHSKGHGHGSNHGSGHGSSHDAHGGHGSAAGHPPHGSSGHGGSHNGSASHGSSKASSHDAHGGGHH